MPVVAEQPVAPTPHLPPGCQLIFQPSPDIMAQVYALRVQAWRARTQAFPNIDEWRDDNDADALHWAIVAQTGDAPPLAIAAARMTIHARLADVPSAEIYDGLLPADLPGPIASINRLVVARDHAGRGLSQVLDHARIAFAREAACRCMIGRTLAGARRRAELQAQGFVALGEARPYHHGPLATFTERQHGEVPSFGYDAGADAFILTLCPQAPASLKPQKRRA
jgi:GNAT superfamily N-acetyltransferase